MGNFIWAFVAILVLILIITFIPLGLSTKGKTMIPIVSFILAMGGAVAQSSLPLWEAGLLCILLIYLVAYIMDKRMGDFLFKEIPRFTRELDENEPLEIYSKEDPVDKNHLFIFPERSVDPVQEDKRNEVIPYSILSDNVKSNNNEPLLFDEDISILLERVVEEYPEGKMADEEPEESYLRDLEDLLLFESSRK